MQPVLLAHIAPKDVEMRAMTSKGLAALVAAVAVLMLTLDGATVIQRMAWFFVIPPLTLWGLAVLRNAYSLARHFPRQQPCRLYLCWSDKELRLSCEDAEGNTQWNKVLPRAENCSLTLRINHHSSWSGNLLQDVELWADQLCPEHDKDTWQSIRLLRMVMLPCPMSRAEFEQMGKNLLKTPFTDSLHAAGLALVPFSWEPGDARFTLKNRSIQLAAVDALDYAVIKHYVNGVLRRVSVEVQVRLKNGEQLVARTGAEDLPVVLDLMETWRAMQGLPEETE